MSLATRALALAAQEGNDGEEYDLIQTLAFRVRVLEAEAIKLRSEWEKQKGRAVYWRREWKLMNDHFGSIPE